LNALSNAGRARHGFWQKMQPVFSFSLVVACSSEFAGKYTHIKDILNENILDCKSILLLGCGHYDATFEKSKLILGHLVHSVFVNSCIMTS
jgi:hypothetical protein